MATPAKTPNAIGDEIRRIRDTLGLTIKDLARRANVPWQTLQAYESGRVVPPADRLLQIVHAARNAPKPFRFDVIARHVFAQAA